MYSGKIYKQKMTSYLPSLAALVPIAQTSSVPEVRITVRDEYLDGFIPQLFCNQEVNYYKQNGTLGTINFTPHAANPAELKDPGWFIFIPAKCRKIYEKNLGKIDFTPHPSNSTELEDSGWRMFLEGPDLV